MFDTYKHNENGTYQLRTFFGYGSETTILTDCGNTIALNSCFKIKAGKNYGGRYFWGWLDGRIAYTLSDKPYIERKTDNWPECDRYIWTIESKTAVKWLRNNAQKDLDN